MKAILTKPDVEKAIETLKTAGKKPTFSAIHAVLGNKGSLSTLVKLKAQIEAEAVDERDSEEGRRVFRELWALAVQEGRKQKEAELEEMTQALDAMAAESEKMEGEVAAATQRVAEVEKQRDTMVAELAKANEQVTVARATGEQNATKLSEALERIAKLQQDHAAEVSDLRRQLTEAQKHAHTVELQLARTEAKLEQKRR